MASELALGSLNRARYAGLDFDTHNDDLLARLQVKYAAEFNDFSVASLGIMLLDLTAYGLDTLSFYLDRRATDMYLSTARTRRSVARTSRQLGYKMGGAVASSVDLRVVVNDVHTFDVPIPAGFQFDGPDDLIFEAAEEVLFTPSEQGLDNFKYVPCYEGETIQETFVSDGTSAQVFELRRVPSDKYVVQGAVVCTVDGATWEEVSLLEYGATDQVEVGYNDVPATIRFGDGIFGNIPAAETSIVVTYVASRGKSGQVQASTIESETSSLVVSFTEIALTVTNPEGSVGGDDWESISSAKAFAPKVRKSGDSAVVGEDYEALAGSFSDPLFGRVAVAKALSSRSAATDLTVQNYLLDIRNGVDVLNTSLLAATTAIVSALDSIDSSVITLNSDVVDITSQQSTIDTEATSARSNTRTIKDYTGEIGVDATDIGNFVTDGKSAVDAIATHATTSQLTTADKNSLKGYFDLIQSEATAIGSAVVNAEALANAAISDLNSVLSESSDLSVSIVSISSVSSSINTQSAAIRTEASGIDTDNDTLVDLVDPTLSSSAVYGINTHFDRILANDCKANLVTVPILVRDSGGFYTAPSSGLVSSLQTFLDGRKEVTQTVSVTSGENFLISAVVRARVGVFSGYSEAVIQTSVVSVIEGVLRDRDFGVSLYESDLDDVILDVVGVAFVNTRIQGHLDTDGTTILTSRLDSDSNLIILDSEIISRGTVTVTTEVVSE